MRPTIRDVARAAGVSKAAVSYVINGREGVGSETTRRILQVIEAMNYRPSAIARGLAGRRTQTLGLVIPDITDMFYADIIRGVEQAANEHNYTMSLGTTHSDADRERDVVDALASGRADGVILMTYHLGQNLLDDLITRGRPVVLLDDPSADDRFCSVSVDNVDAGYLATRYLIELGHRRIAFVHGSQGSRDTWLRYQGFQKALAEHGLEAAPEWIGMAHFRREDSRRLVAEWLTRAERPTAIFAANDQMAIGALEAAAESGFRVPDHLSVVGVDDIEAASMVAPGLTTVRQPTYQMGRRAAELLIAQLEGDEPRPRRIVLKAELVVRGSCQEM